MPEPNTVPPPPAARRGVGSSPLVPLVPCAIVILAGLQPFAAFLAENAERLVLVGTILLLAVLWSAALVGLFLAVRLLRRTWPPMAVAAAISVVNLLFFNYSAVLPVEPPSLAAHVLALALWGVLAGLASVLVVKISRAEAFGTFAVLLLGVWVAGLLLTFVMNRPDTGGEPPRSYTGAPFGAFERTPNVYWFVLDEYTSTAWLERMTGTDNTWFTDALVERGFEVSQTSRSSYLETHLSVTSTLAMEYAYLPDLDQRHPHRLASEALNGDNAVVDTFRANGYRYAYATDGYSEWARCDKDSSSVICVPPVHPPLALRDPYAAIVRSTPVGSFNHSVVHSDVASVLEGTRAIDTDDGPLFLLAHVMSPHFPFRYDEQCARRDVWLIGGGLTGSERAAAYANDLRCVSQEVIARVDQILADDPDAIIILQGDHGTRLGFSFDITYDEVTDAQLQEGFATLNAIRLPPECAHLEVEGEPLVNTFRLVFACLSGEVPELLPSRQFFAEFTRIDTLVEVPQERLVP
ncbi:MAG: sulfatase-like hydrolase/transferase [Acidimicrobiia bacterium]|nr:sulfatase-like hydrolase/transferase [Acidimicrobiia bacterium]